MKTNLILLILFLNNFYLYAQEPLAIDKTFNLSCVHSIGDGIFNSDANEVGHLSYYDNQLYAFGSFSVFKDYIYPPICDMIRFKNGLAYELDKTFYNEDSDHADFGVNSIFKDSSFYVACISGNYRRFNYWGKIDLSFNQHTTYSSLAWDIAMQNDSLIITPGYFKRTNPSETHYCERMNINTGKRDTSFNSGHSGGNDWMSKVLMNPYQSMYLGGEFITYNDKKTALVCRVNANGSLHPNFESPFDTGYVYLLKYNQDSSKIIVGGSLRLKHNQQWTSLARIYLDGRLDTTFNNQNNAQGHPMYTFVFTPDSGYIFGGLFTDYQGYIRGRIVKTDKNGFIDTNYFKGNGFYDGTHYSRLHTMIWEEGTGNLLVGGDFTQYNGYKITGMARFYSLSVGKEPIIKAETKVPLKIYPNPAHKEINIQFKYTEESEISILDWKGQLIDRIKIQNREKLQYDVSQLPKGMYILLLKNKHQINAEKFIITE